MSSNRISLIINKSIRKIKPIVVVAAAVVVVSLFYTTNKNTELIRTHHRPTPVFRRLVTRFPQCPAQCGWSRTSKAPEHPPAAGVPGCLWMVFGTSIKLEWFSSCTCPQKHAVCGGVGGFLSCSWIVKESN